MSLDLSSCGIEELPPEIGQLKTLQTLSLRDNKLTSLPAEIGQLEALSSLDLEGNCLKSLPVDLFKLTKLRLLDLRKNQIDVLSGEISNLQALRILYLFDNMLVMLPHEIGELTQLRQLWLGANQLSELPASIGNLALLEVLRIPSNNVIRLPPEIGRLKKLLTLDVSNNRLEELPPEIGDVTLLRSLKASRNQLSGLPNEIVRLTWLTSLILDDNRLDAFPPEAVRLRSLNNLSLAKNHLRSLPTELVWLENLQHLNLEGNELTVAPSEVGQLTRLRSLNLQDNRLRSLPLAFGRLKLLASHYHTDFDASRHGLRLEGNPLPDPYPSLIAEGPLDGTIKILALLRGEIEQSDVESKEEEGVDPISTALPSVPQQGIGPHFEVDDKGIIRFAPPEALDKHGNNVRRLRTLHPTIREIANDLVEALSRGNSPHAHLCDRIEAYRDLVDQDLESVDFSLLYVAGVRLSNAERATLGKIGQGELPPLDLSDREAVDSLIQLHSTFMMSTTEGIEALGDEERYNRDPSQEKQYRAVAIEFAERLQNQPDIIDQDVASVVLGAVEQIGQGLNLERSGVVGTATLKNVTVILATGATVALPVVGHLLLGEGGTLAGGLAGIFASEGLKRSKSFATMILPLSQTIDTTSDIEVPQLVNGIAEKFRPQLNFVLKVEPILRQLAGRREQFSWIHGALDWIKTHPSDDENSAF